MNNSKDFDNPDNPNNPTANNLIVRRKTISILRRFSNNDYRIVRFCSEISKNVYNSTIFCSTIFYKYKNNIFKELLDKIKLKAPIDNNQNSIHHITEEDIETMFYDIFNIYYTRYCNIKKDLNNNNDIIYDTITSTLKNKNITIVNNNFYKIKNQILRILKKNNNIKNKDDDEMFMSIVDRILISIYRKNYFKTLDEIQNNIPCTINNKIFINQIKKGELLFKDINNEKVNYKKLVEEYLNKLNVSFKDRKIKKKKEIKNTKDKLENKYTLKSDRNYISRFTYKHLYDNEEKLTSDLKVNIINKAFDALNSYYARKQKGQKCNYPKYLSDGSVYNLMFPHSHNKEEIKNGKKVIRLPIGRYISDNYSQITKNKYLEELHKTKNNIVYVHLKDLIDNNNFVDPKNKYNAYGFSINKNHPKIINGSYLYIPKPTKIDKPNVKIVQIEIVPIYDGEKYKINYTYDETYKQVNNVNNNTNIDDYLSIDLGLKNLMSIYDPSGEQKIIGGNYIHRLNGWFNKIIDSLKSKTKKNNNQYTSKRIRHMLIRRENKINHYFNVISKWFAENYKHKRKIIIGYNTNWKNGVCMGKKNNRKFYEIPYCKLLKRLKEKMASLNIEVVTNEESYTSKCDALAFEKVGNHGDNYMGIRISRGLFSSSTRKLLNADINGAINIMRKYLNKKGIIMDVINGVNICNPRRVILSTKV